MASLNYTKNTGDESVSQLGIRLWRDRLLTSEK